MTEDHILTLLGIYKKMTSTMVAFHSGEKLPQVISTLRYFVKQKVIAECNGFYYLPEQHHYASRHTYCWIEGAYIPGWLKSMKTGKQMMTVLAEFNGGEFTASPQLKLCRLKLNSGVLVDYAAGTELSRHQMLRYLPVDDAGDTTDEAVNKMIADIFARHP